LLYLAGVNPALDFPDDGLGARAVESAGFVVAQDFFLTESTRRADVVLPAATAYERAGTLTNWEGRAQPVAPAVAAPGLAQADFEILAQVAAAAGVAFPTTLEAIRTEMRALARAPEIARPVHIPELGAG
jgi:predicted molibdopterin-dependent oxidoreductase YjgC